MGRVKTPEGYTAKRAEEILETALDGAGTETGLLREAGDRYPNLIVIMNETLADLPAIYGLRQTQTCFPIPFHWTISQRKGPYIGLRRRNGQHRV